VGQESRSGQVDAYPTDELGRPGPGQLLLDHEVLARAEAPSAVDRGPGDPDPSGAGQVGLPPASEGDFLGQVLEARGKPHAVLPGEVLAQPGAEFMAEPFLVRRGCQVHGATAA
jgi:hypothetical protein